MEPLSIFVGEHPPRQCSYQTFKETLLEQGQIEAYTPNYATARSTKFLPLFKRLCRLFLWSLSQLWSCMQFWDPTNEPLLQLDIREGAVVV